MDDLGRGITQNTMVLKNTGGVLSSVVSHWSICYTEAVLSSWQEGQRCLGHGPCSGGMTLSSGDRPNFITDQMATSPHGILPRPQPTFFTIDFLLPLINPLLPHLHPSLSSVLGPCSTYSLSSCQSPTSHLSSLLKVHHSSSGLCDLLSLLLGELMWASMCGLSCVWDRL